jgi:peptidase A4-like protein
MPRRLARAATALAGVSVLALTAGSLAGTSAGAARTPLRPAAVRSGGVMVRSAASRATLRSSGTQQSGNWSGYVVQPKAPVTQVTASFIVPKAGYDLPGIGSQWAGIGGDGTTDLIQAGVEVGSFPSLPLVGPQYYAWYETLPSSETQLTGCTGDGNCTVTPGDRINVRITETATKSNVWTIYMQDIGRWTTTLKNINYGSSNASAEWVYEATSVLVSPLIAPGVGSTQFVAGGGNFLGNTFSVSGGAPQSIKAGSPSSIDMSVGGLSLFAEATPSALSASNGQAFNVCTYTSSCAAPS